MKHTQAHICSFIAISGAYFLPFLHHCCLLWTLHSRAVALSSDLAHAADRHKWLLTAVIVCVSYHPARTQQTSEFISFCCNEWAACAKMAASRASPRCHQCFYAPVKSSARCSCLLYGRRVMLSISRATICLHLGLIPTKCVYSVLFKLCNVSWNNLLLVHLERWEQCFSNWDLQKITLLRCQKLGKSFPTKVQHSLFGMRTFHQLRKLPNWQARLAKKKKVCCFNKKARRYFAFFFIAHEPKQICCQKKENYLFFVLQMQQL